MRWSPDVRQAMHGRARIRVQFSRTMAAACLWDFGEDELAERALVMTDGELGVIQRIAAVYEDPGYPLPITGQRISHGHVTALAAVAYFEGRLRPLARTRRRRNGERPSHLAPQPPDPRTGL